MSGQGNEGAKEWEGKGMKGQGNGSGKGMKGPQQVFIPLPTIPLPTIWHGEESRSAWANLACFGDLSHILRLQCEGPLLTETAATRRGHS
jgi:hypothetical protein